MKVLLIGGTGVLSKDIAKLCTEKCYDVYMINRGNRKNYEAEGAKVIIGDINNPINISKKIENLEFDVVVDFLSFTPAQLKRNIRIFGSKCKQYLFISSATAYSIDDQEEYITEATPLTNDNWEYSKNKKKCEELIENEMNQTNNSLKFTIIRPYITYGNTRIPYAFVSKKYQWTLIDRIINEKPIIVWDKGENLCTLTHTEDFAVGVVGLFMNPKAYGEAFHITSDESLTWVEVIKSTARSINKDVKIIFLPSKIIESYFKEMRGELTGDKALNRRFDNSKIKSAVRDYECKISYSQGIKETIKHYKQTKGLQKIDKAWNAKVDFLIFKYRKQLIDQLDETNQNYYNSKISYCLNIIKVKFYEIINFFKRIHRFSIIALKRIIFKFS